MCGEELRYVDVCGYGIVERGGAGAIGVKLRPDCELFCQGAEWSGGCKKRVVGPKWAQIFPCQHSHL